MCQGSHLNVVPVTPRPLALAPELSGLDRVSIDVKATDYTVVITAECRSPQMQDLDAADGQTPLMSKFRYGTRSRSFRLPVAIDREQLNAYYRLPRWSAQCECSKSP